MQLEKLNVKDKELFLSYLSIKRHNLCAYNFANIYIWKCLYKISWKIINDCLCIFFKDNSGAFLYLPPLGKKVTKDTVDEVFRILDSINKNKELSRIENIEEGEVELYRGFGFKLKPKPADYLYLRKELVELKGEKYKSQRASYNYFLRNYRYNFRDYRPTDQKTCLSLYERWSQSRRQKHKDRLYQCMLEDSGKALEIMLDNYDYLDIVGKVVEINSVVSAFSFGSPLNSDTFCILYEITDLNIKGLAQFIFREFCAEFSNFTYINTMDDSGLENLKVAKQRYRPQRLISNYIATR